MIGLASPTRGQNLAVAPLSDVIGAGLECPQKVMPSKCKNRNVIDLIIDEHQSAFFCDAEVFCQNRRLSHVALPADGTFKSSIGFKRGQFGSVRTRTISGVGL